MTTHDDPLAGIDLDAWQPPPPPGGVADAVLRRMREPVAVAAHEIGERTRRRWLWMTVGAIATAAVAGVLVIAPGTAPTPAPVSGPAVDGHGEVMAERASHVELGPTSAELEAGTELRWQRDRRRVTVEQRRGTATWRVGVDDTIVIDAGAMGASVEASGASLRVEVQMHINSSDARVVAASAVTAVAVALVTVIAYQGHVKVMSGGQTVNVAAGGAVEVKPGEPAREVRNVATAAPPGDPRSPERVGTEPVVAGAPVAGPVTVRPLPPPPPPPPSPFDGDPASLTAQNVAPGILDARRIKGDRSIVPDRFEQLAIQSAGDTRVIASIKLCVDVAGKVSQIRVLKSSGYPGYDEKIKTVAKGWEYQPLEIDGKAVPVCTAITFLYTQR